MLTVEGIDTAALRRAIGGGLMPKVPTARSAASKRPTRQHPPVKLGYVDANGISPSLYVLIERGAHRRPKIVQSMRGAVELRFKEQFAAVRIHFGEEQVLVEDAKEDEDRPRPDLVIQGSLPDVVQLAAAPLMGGLPKLTDKRGRAALASMAGRRVKIEGSPMLARRLLKLLEI